MKLLGLALEREKLKTAYDSAAGRYRKAREDPDTSDKKAEKLKETALEKKRELKSVDAAIRAIQNDRMGDPQVSIMAYVTFQDEESFLKCLKDFRPGLFAWIFRPQSLRMRDKYRLVVKQAPPPGDIKWQNLQFGYWERQFRQFNISMITMAVLAVAFISIAGVTTLEGETETEYDQEGCRAECAYLTDPLTLENVRLREIYETCFQEDLASNATAAAGATATAAARRLLQETQVGASNATNATAVVYETDPEFGTPEQQDAGTPEP